MGMYETAVTKIFDAVVVAAGGTEISQALDLAQLRTDNSTLQAEITGDGRVKFLYELSADNVTFLAVDGVNNEIKAGLVKTSGPGGDGKILINFNFKLAEYMRIKVVETGMANTATVTVNLVTR
jgi:hypothetical protein